MIKFFFLFFLSSSAFALPGVYWKDLTIDVNETLKSYPIYSERNISHNLNQYIGGFYQNNDTMLYSFVEQGGFLPVYSVSPRFNTLFVLGWFTATVSTTDIFLDGTPGANYGFSYARGLYSLYDGYGYGYTELPFDFNSCPDRLSPVAIAYFEDSFVQHPGSHSVCMADFNGNNSDDGCGPIPAGTDFNIHYLIACPVFTPSKLASQETAIKKNKLLAESNSKLGSIANSNSTSTGIFPDISSGFNSILSAIYATFGFPNFFQDSKITDDEQKLIDQYKIDNPDELIAVNQLPSLISGDSECPSAISFSVFNRTQQISYQPICEFAVRIKPLVIASARVAAAWILIGAL